MKITLLLFLLMTGLVAGRAFAAEKSPVSSPELTEDTSPAAIAKARERGAASAARDIKEGTLRILYYGLPWGMNKPLVDEKTGWRIQVVGGCTVMEPFRAEVEAYNNAMIAFHDLKLQPKQTP